VATIAAHELNASLDHLNRHVNTSSLTRGLPLIVTNTLPWERTDVVSFTLPEDMSGPVALFDARGKEVPSQLTAASQFERQVMFIASRVPAMGYAAYELRRQTPASTSFALRAEGLELENALFNVKVDGTSGWVTSIVDKRNGAELLGGNGNELQLLEDKPSAWDAWNIGLTGVKYPSAFRGGELIERGPVRTVLRLHRDYLKPGTVKDFPTEDFPSSFFTQDIILYDGLDRVDFVTGVDWWEDKTMLKVAFPLSFADSAATYEIPYGTIRRSTLMRTSVEQAQVEVPAERWADVSVSGHGVALLNNAKYGYDIKGHTMRLSLLRSPRWPDPTADRGKHTISYALYPHAGDWASSGVYRRGEEFNTPLLARFTGRHGGSLPLSSSFVAIHPTHIVLSSIKEAEEGKAWVMQWYDVTGEAGDAEIRLPATPRKAVMTNFLEDDGAPLRVNGPLLTVPTPAHGIVTIKVYW
jgi:alpha-mannosidase